MKGTSIKVLSIPLWASNIWSALDLVVKLALSNSKLNLKISATGAHGMVFAQKHESFAQCLQNFYINLPDGMPGVWVGRIKGAMNMRRCYGPDFFKEVIVQTSNKDVRHFFCGGKEGVADELKVACEGKFKNFNIVGTHCPPFRELSKGEWIELGDQINTLKADIVWIGLSTPKQEFFATALANYCETKFIITVGAAFDFHTDKVRQAPSYMQKFGLEWLFRLLMEPKRLWRRYFEIVPLFIYYNLKELSKFVLRLR